MHKCRGKDTFKIREDLRNEAFFYINFECWQTFSGAEKCSDALAVEKNYKKMRLVFPEHKYDVEAQRRELC